MAVGTDLPPDESDEAELWARYARDRDIETRNRLIEFYLPLCRNVAKATYARRGNLQVEFLDYVQCATIGMIEAVTYFDPSLGVPFAAYATKRIRGSILNSLEPLSEQYTQIGLRNRIEKERLDSLATPDAAGQGERRRRAKRELLTSLSDLAVGLALAHLLEGSGMISAPGAERGYRQEFYHGAQQRQLRETLLELVRALPEKERRVVVYHYFQGLDFTEIAELFGLSKGRISQIHKQALQLLREAYGGLGGLSMLL